MSDAKQATPPAELERQICSATVPKNEREWWARHEISRLQESNRLRAELLAAAKAELAALRAALAEADEPVSDEPVAWMVDGCVTVREDYASLLRWNVAFVGVGRAIPDSWKPLLYTHPPRREPLTEEVIAFEWEEHTGHSILGGEPGDGRQMFISPDEVMAFARAVERAHGIGDDE